MDSENQPLGYIQSNCRGTTPPGKDFLPKAGQIMNEMRNLLKAKYLDS
jgi:hypothetical protein